MISLISISWRYERNSCFQESLTFDVLFFHLLNLHQSVVFTLAIQPSHVSLQQRHVQPESNRGGSRPENRPPWTRFAAAAASRMTFAHVHVSANCPVSVAVGGCQVSHEIVCIHFRRMNNILNIDLHHCCGGRKCLRRKANLSWFFLYRRNQALINCSFRNSVCLHLLTCLSAAGTCWVSEPHEVFSSGLILVTLNLTKRYSGILTWKFEN